MDQVLVIGSGQAGAGAAAALESAAFAVRTAVTLDEALDVVQSRPPRSLVIDCDPAYLDPVQVNGFLRAVRLMGWVPTLAMVPGEAAACTEILYRVSDFIEWPFDASELLVRHQRLLEPGPWGLVTRWPLTIDTHRLRVSLRGHAVDLSPKEYHLLVYLATQPGRLLSRQTLLQDVWGEADTRDSRRLDMTVRRLRSKLLDPSGDFIETTRSQGYRFRT